MGCQVESMGCKVEKPPYCSICEGTEKEPLVPRSYPECEKMRAVHEKSQAIGEFLDWLSERGIVLASYYEEAGLSPHRVNVEALLAEYFGIDLDKAEQEKRTILEELRKQHDNPDDS